MLSKLVAFQEVIYIQHFPNLLDSFCGTKTSDLWNSLARGRGRHGKNYHTQSPKYKTTVSVAVAKLFSFHQSVGSW